MNSIHISTSCGHPQISKIINSLLHFPIKNKNVLTTVLREHVSMLEERDKQHKSFQEQLAEHFQQVTWKNEEKVLSMVV